MKKFCEYLRFYALKVCFQFTGNFTDYNYIKQWLTDKCIPLVREVTFENVEELTEEGLPFLLLFRNRGDKEGDKKFTELVNCMS